MNRLVRIRRLCRTSFEVGDVVLPLRGDPEICAGIDRVDAEAPVLRTDHTMNPYPPPPRISVRILRVVAWNLLLIIAGLVVIAAVGEVIVRLSTPFERRDHSPGHFVPGVGLIYEPGGEHRWTNYRDFWNISWANSWGFLDREPISLERAAESCHVTIIGDSFIAARQVPVSDKVQVRLDELAAEELPELDITTSAFGIQNTAQVNQLPIYDRYASRLSPKLLALVFTDNDMYGSSAALVALRYDGWDPDRAPYTYAERFQDGTMKLRPPSPDYDLLLVDNRTWISRMLLSLRWSEFAVWLERKLPKSVTRSGSFLNVLASRVEILKRRPRYATIDDGWTSANWGGFYSLLFSEDPPPVFREGLALAGFALDEFMERARRDGADLVILATHRMGDRNSRPWLLLNEMAAVRGIPVINLHEYIIAQGATIGNAQFSRDHHWNAAGHQWAAEALLEYLKENLEICTTIDQAGVERPRLEN